MPRKSKDIGVIIEFDDKEYSYEETSLLWLDFTQYLQELQKKKSL